jgi:putative PIN family toxin of toxin-antitoxin system
MPAKKIRVILDTNWYISATINKNSRRILYQLLTNKNIVVLYCDEIIAEYQQVIIRNKFNKIIKPKQAFRFVDFVLPKLEYITLQTAIKASRDPDDNYLLSLSIDGNADYLITGDMDLLVLGQIRQTKIVRLNQLSEHISGLSL